MNSPDTKPTPAPNAPTITAPAPVPPGTVAAPETEAHGPQQQSAEMPARTKA
jgi:hypothetical protein